MRVSVMVPISKYGVCLFVLLAASVALAEENTLRHYPLPGHGALQISTPGAWQEKVQRRPNPLPPTIVFTPESGSSYQILLTPMYPLREEISLPTPAQLRNNVEREAKRVQEQALEKTIPVQELKGADTIGYYYRVTDKSSQASEYKYMTQGALLLKKSTLLFTILTNDGADGIEGEAMTMLKNAAQVED